MTCPLGVSSLRVRRIQPGCKETTRALVRHEKQQCVPAVSIICRVEDQQNGTVEEAMPPSPLRWLTMKGNIGGFAEVLAGGRGTLGHRIGSETCDYRLL